MTQTKHTAGPWVIGTNCKAITANAGGGCFTEICRVHGQPVDVGGSRKANALLIAAAPDLLEALKETQLFLAALVLKPQTVSLEAAEHIIEMRDKNKTAIAKAEGQI